MSRKRAIAGIMAGLDGLLTIGMSLFVKGAALPMMSFYSVLLKAQTARQDADAKELKTQWRDRLGETTARLKLELEEAAGALDNPQELMNIAAKYGDSQLRAALESEGPAGAQKVLQQRDKAL